MGDQAREREKSEIESIPYFGTTWYERGASYWFRRAVWSLICVCALTIFALVTWGLCEAIATAPISIWVRLAILAVVAAAIVRSSLKAWSAFDVVNQARRSGKAVSLAEASGEAPRTYAERRRLAVTGGSTTGALAATGSVLGSGLLVISAVFNIGWGVVLLISSFQRYASPYEFAAWQKIERKRRQHAD